MQNYRATIHLDGTVTYWSAYSHFHRDGTVTYWSVYRQVWVRRATTVPDEELAAWDARDRELWSAKPHADDEPFMYDYPTVEGEA